MLQQGVYTHPIWKGHWFYLFHALLLLLVLYPYLETPAEEARPWLLDLLNTTIVLSIVYAASWRFRQFIVALILGIPTILVYWVPTFPYDDVAVLICSSLLYLSAILFIFLNLLRTRHMGTEEIYGAMSLYILLGLTWSAFFQGIEWAYPGSFYISSVQNLDQALTWSDFLYFSFTTLTTLGYGDITPVTSQARSLAIIEAISGVIFLAAAISGAIAIHVSQRIKGKTDVSV